MMICPEYRRLLLADPGHPSDQMRAHLAHCPGCTQYTDRILRFEGRLEQALQIDMVKLPPRRAVGLPPGHRWQPGRRELAIAASALLAVFAAAGLWLAAPGRSLAAAVVNHMPHEPDAWTRTEIAVPESKLDAVMRESGAHWRPGAGLVSYVQSCAFRGHQVPHLVVQTPTGPVTVMILVHENVRSGMHFDEQGYRGMIVPVPGHGSLAVLERNDDTDPQAVEAVSAQVLHALDWSK